MDIKAVKLELVQRLLQTESEELLKKITELLDSAEDYSITDSEKAMLEERKARYARNEGDSYSWEELKSKARKSRK